MSSSATLNNPVVISPATSKMANFKLALDSFRRETSYRLGVVALLVSIANIMNGYDNTFWAGFIANPKFCQIFGQGSVTVAPGVTVPFPTAQQQATATTTTSGSSFVGALIGAQLVRKYGYRNTFVIYACILIIGTAMELTSFIGDARWPQIIVGKCIVGISSGIGALEAVGYLSEIAPTGIRGAMVALSTLSYTFGGMVGSAILLGISNERSDLALYLPFCFQLVLPLVIAVLYFYVPESPRWLLSRNRRDKALANLVWLRGADVDAEAELAGIEEAIKRQDETRANSAAWSQLLKGTDLRRSLVVFITCVLWSLSGISFVGSYQVILFRQIGIASPFLISLIGACVTVAAIMVSMAVIDSVGRRPVLLFGGMAASSCLLAFAIIAAVSSNYKGATGSGMATLLIFYNLAFGLSWAITPTILSAELPSEQARPKTIALGSAGQQGAIMLVAAVNPYLQDVHHANLGGKVAFIYASFGFISIVWVFFMVPETRGRPLQELNELFELRIPARSFKNYKLPQQTARDIDEDEDRKLAVEHHESA